MFHLVFQMACGKVDCVVSPLFAASKAGVLLSVHLDGNQRQDSFRGQSQRMTGAAVTHLFEKGSKQET